MDQYGVPAPAMPSLLRYTQISAGVSTTYGLRGDGTVAKFGSGASGAGRVEGLGGARQIAAGAYHAYVLCSDGRLVGDGSDADGAILTPTNVGSVQQVACGWNFTYAVRTDGSVIGWGRNDCGQTDTPANLMPVVQVACGGFHTYALQTSGTLAGWGLNSAGQTITPPAATQVRQVVCASSRTYALRGDGSVLGWGVGYQQEVPSGLNGVTQIACGNAHAYARRSDGTLVGWGANQKGQTTTPLGLVGVSLVACGSDHTIALKDDGTAIAWGRNDTGQSSVPTAREGFVSIATGSSHAYGVRADGSVLGWGSNIYGQTSTPAGLGFVQQVSCGEAHTYALRSDGTLASWGGGLGSTGFSSDCGQTSTPAGLGAAAMVSCGAYHTYALLTSGTVVGWGGGLNVRDGWSADCGQTSTPSNLGIVTQVACGGYHTYALKPDGTLVGWGGGPSVDGWAIEYGQAVTPVGLVGVRQVACGTFHTIALKNDGTVVGWGQNDSGESTAPVGTVGVTKVACGFALSYARTSDGRLVGWGRNEYGQASTPANLTGVTDIACGQGITIALLSPQASTCSNAGGAGTATIRVSGCAWQRVGAWVWSNGGCPQVPGAQTDADLGVYGSVGSDCQAQARTLTSRSGTSLLVPAAASASGNDFSIRVGDTANLAGRLWLMGVSGGGDALPETLDIPVLSAGTLNGNFDLIQSDVPPPAGFFLTLVPSDVNGRTLLSLRLLPLPGNAELAGANAGTFSGTAVAAETIDLNHDGFDDLALAVDFGAGQNGLIQVLLNDGAGNLGGTSVLCPIPPQPTCLAVGDVDGDGRKDVAVGIASDQSARVYRDSGMGTLVASTVMSAVGGTPTSVIVIPSGGASAMPTSSSVGVGVTGSKLKIFQNGTLQQEITMAGTVETVRGGNTTGSGGVDIVTGGTTSTTVTMLPVTETGFVQVLRRQTNGQYAIVQSLGLTARPKALDVADLDGDGLDDIVSANADPVLPAAGGALPVLTIFRNTNGVLGGAVPYQPAGASGGLSVSLIDADGDGDRDIVGVYRKIGQDSEAALLRVDTLGAGTPISIGQTTVLDASNPILSARGNLDGVGGQDLYLVDNGGANLVASARSVKPYLAVVAARQGDLDGDGLIGPSDVSILLLDFGPCGGCASDLDGSGAVDNGDLSFLLLLFD